MKGIILAAGEGKRLRPLTQDIPKSMVNFCGTTLLERQIEVMQKCGINDIIVITGYKAEKINIPNINYLKNKNFEKTNMIETLFCAENELVGDVIISYADIIYEKNILEKLIQSEEEISIVIDKKWEDYWKKRFDDPLKDAESLKIDEDGNISEIGQKANNIAEIDRVGEGNGSLFNDNAQVSFVTTKGSTIFVNGAQINNGIDEEIASPAYRSSTDSVDFEEYRDAYLRGAERQAKAIFKTNWQSLL